MKSKTNRLLSVLMLSLISLSSSCASWALLSPPELANRSLRISPDLPGLEYQYEVCHHKVLGICTKTRMEKITYDLRDEKVRHQLIDMNFVARVREK